MQRNPLDHVTIVLAGPKDARNIGAVCRAMKTMGLSRLVIAGACGHDVEVVRILAVHAFDVYERARFCACLSEAVSGVHFVAGVTRRRGRFRKYSSLPPEDLARKIGSMVDGETAIVFGNEESGLSDEELGQCHVAVHIPSSPDFPSLNLSHAVQIVAYAVFRMSQGEALPRHKPVAGDELESLVTTITNTLAALGFFSQVSNEDLGVFFRDILGRAMLDAREASRLEKVFHKIRGMAGKNAH